MLGSLRKEKGITQEVLATKLGIKRSTIAMWETGKIKTRTDDLYAIAAVLNVSVDKVLDCFKPAQ